MNPSELMSIENSGLLDRVADLEKRSADLGNEVAGLRNSLADCLRRLSLLESNKGTALCQTRPYTTTPSRPGTTVATTPTNKPAPHRSEGGPNRRGNSKPRPTTNVSTSRDGPVGSHNLQRIGNKSASSTALDRHASTGPKEPTYIANEGILRVFLHGRAINVYLPSTIMDNFDLYAPQPAPDETLKLEWVYGYRGRDCRNNLFYLPTGEIIYFVAAVVVLYNIEEQCQRHYLEHTDDVTSIALHPDCITVATGQAAGHGKIQNKPHVRIWSSVDLRTLRILGLGEFGRGICCISFSKTDGGARLCVVDDAQDHVISVWEWQKGKKITDTKCSADPVVAAEFHPLDESSIVTCGKNQLNFWTLDGNTLSKKSAIFETGKISCDKPKFVLCMAFAENGDLLTGDSSGNIIVWRHGSNHISQICHNAHDGGIFSLCVTKDGRLVSGGGKDRRLVFFDVALNPTDEVKELPELHGSVRTIIQGPGDVLLVGTTRNTILQIAPGMEFSSLMFGHSDEFWALASHPQSHQFLTAGNDRMVILWDALSKQAVWAKELNDPIHCATFYPPYSEPVDGLVNGDRPESPNGLVQGVAPLIALGSTSGRWLVLDSIRHEVIAAHSDGIGEQIQCISYSPNGQYIALGSRDNSIYVYQVLEGGRKYSRVGRCSGHSSFVLHLDWSADSRYLRSESGDYELLFWTGNDCRQVVSLSSLRDVDWATQTCTLGWCVTGVWPDGGDGTDVNACNIYPNSALLATADDFGKVKLFQYPAIRPKAEFHAYNGHSSHVTNVAFLYDGSRLISTGGKDTAVLQWEVCV
ncbi:Echinoderm microtubule-associated protein-like 1 [Clonorchis sinensis]|uniref:Echinoderm microtubule-associated protein-like 1 n=1 Tax=Clonorchis sinensis TaxID=79923 RepID=A0A8T1MGX4_CLOSI|nr:Echinoderm microtubule-associated protein-like 1 [Clonorchis sinensis]